MLVGLLAASWMACAPKEEFVETSLPKFPAETTTLRIGTGAPRLHISGIELQDDGASTASFEVTEIDRLEFVPILLRAGTVPPPELETTIEVDGRREVVSTEALQRRVALKGADGIRALLSPVSVDLTAYRGQTIRIHWALPGEAPTEGSHRVAIGNPRLFAGAVRERPDVLFLCSDTHRYDYALEPEGVELMPRLQELAEESVSYPQSFSTASWTMPSIATALTGLFSRYHGVGRLADTVEIEGFDPSTVPNGQFAFKAGGRIRMLSTYSSQILSLPETLSEHGYTTAIVAGNPLYFLSGLAFDGTDIAVDAAVAPGDGINEAAFAALETAASERPLFLLAHYMDVHHWKQWYFESDAERNSPEYREAVLESYRRGAQATDEAIAKLLERWEQVRGKGAIVVFYADHGEHLMDPHDELRLGHGNTMDDVLLRIPMTIRYPEGVTPAAPSPETQAGLVDIMPTLIDALDLRDPDTASYADGYGQSLLSSLPAGERPLFADFQLYGDELSSVRSGDLKLILHFAEDRAEFIDMRTGQPIEANEGGDEARRLLSQFRAYDEAAEQHRESLVFDRAIDQAEAMRNLEALGYVN